MKIETNAAGQTTPIGLKSRVEVVEKEVTNKAMSSALKSKIESVEKGLHSVETMPSSLQNRVDSLEKKLGSVETTSDDIESRVDSMESSISSLVLASARKVSFSAQLRPEGANAVVLMKERIITCNHVFYNDGSGYNETRGVFTVPVSGVYQFIFFVEGAQNDDDFSCSTAADALYVDGKAQTAAVAEPMHVQQNTQAGNAYISYFRKGQKVVIGTGSSCDKYTIFAYRTTFSGVLLN
ncbi:uncharacterized protein LOC123526474 [Mercenaria mercenaria]|uniref:uncharacterized protein LOC123526474 n=1 Tax=Mercenaria mercenaria TaxID=6596 RepID=UPI00234E3A0B|nr:uncharacterized protein LOC123526474 [Mercenaria mercenaria]